MQNSSELLHGPLNQTLTVKAAEVGKLREAVVHRSRVLAEVCRTVEMRQELDLIRVQYAELRSAYNTLQLAAGEGAAARTRTR